MAKFEEADPRWLVEERPDGQNVGGWHWSEKDISSWGKSTLTELFSNLVLLSTDSENTEVSITSVEEVEGEATVALRKAKQIILYDFTVKLCWKGSISNGTPLTGILTIEMEQDEDPKIVVSVSCAGKLANDMKSVICAKGIPVLKEKIASWVDRLRTEKSIALPTPDEKTSAIQRSSASKTAGKSGVKIETTSTDTASGNDTHSSTEFRNIDMKVQFRASPSHVYEALLNDKMVSAFTQSAASIRAEVGSTFSIFNGNVTGEIVSLTPNKKIVMKWRFQNWQPNYYSEVVIVLSPNSDGCLLTLHHSGVPYDDLERTKEGWSRHYWSQMRAVFGWGITL